MQCRREVSTCICPAVHSTAKLPGTNKSAAAIVAEVNFKPAACHAPKSAESVGPLRHSHNAQSIPCSEGTVQMAMCASAFLGVRLTYIFLKAANICQSMLQDAAKEVCCKPRRLGWALAPWSV